MTEDRLTKKKVYGQLPTVIKTILLMSEGWLVGGALRDIHTEEKLPKDYDIICSPGAWQRTVNSLKVSRGFKFELNTFGGLKWTIPITIAGYDTHIVVDLWPEDLDSYVKSLGRSEYMYSLKNNALLLHEA